MNPRLLRAINDSVAPFTKYNCLKLIDEQGLIELVDGGILVKDKIFDLYVYGKSEPSLQEKIQGTKEYIDKKMHKIIMENEHFLAAYLGKQFGKNHACVVDYKLMETLGDVLVREGRLREFYIPTLEGDTVYKIRYHSKNAWLVNAFVEFGKNRLLDQGSLTSRELYQHPLAIEYDLGEHDFVGGKWGYHVLDYLCFRGYGLKIAKGVARLNAR
jgi:hypothetical protein